MRARAARAAERGELLRVTLRSIGDAVITTDIDGRVTYLNAVGRVADRLDAARTRSASRSTTVFRIVNESTRAAGREPGDAGAARRRRRRPRQPHAC